MTKRQIHLVGHVCTGPTNHHNGSWRHPESDADKVFDATRYQNLAMLYEKGLFDGLFIVDTQAISDLKENSRSLAIERGGALYMLDPMQILAIMAVATRHLGLAATMSTSFNHPYRIARTFGTLDHISKGRAGWNIVTSSMDQEARNYGMDQLLDKNLRYDQADQTVEACLQLWRSWDADALKIDRQSGIFADSTKVHYAKYAGSMVKTEGALTMPQSLQGHPVFMQAGASARGLEFASRWAELIFTHQQEKSPMQAFYADVKNRLSLRGRDPRTCAILPSVEVIVGKTLAIAEERASYLDSFALPEMGLGTISMIFCRDLSQVALDTPLADIEPGPKGPVSAGAYNNVMAIKKDGRGLTLREAAILQATTWWSPRLVGTPEMVVDELQDMFESHCCDGFIITQALSPGGIMEFVGTVVPELQRRGLYRREYTGRTFRENLRSG
jgi:FMN-dependent oxidoreductase (nitrilotriacetate monooxygenase family)